MDLRSDNRHLAWPDFTFSLFVRLAPSADSEQNHMTQVQDGADVAAVMRDGNKHDISKGNRCRKTKRVSACGKGYRCFVALCTFDGGLNLS